MNKLLIVLLAICLVSVHGFAKRDAPVTEKNILDDIKKFGENLGDQLKSALQPDEIKKQFNEFVDKSSKMFNANADAFKPKE